MQLSLVSLVVCATFVSFGETCYKLYGEQIEQIYREFGRPGNLVDTFFKYQPDFILQGTEGYLPNNTICSSGSWSKDLVRITRVLVGGVVTEIHEEIITECKSTLYTPMVETKRIHITDFKSKEGGVVSFCRFDDKEGNDKAVMAIKGYGKWDKQDVDRTVKLMEDRMGISQSAWKSYASTCELTKTVKYGDLVKLVDPPK